jgi:hypothetical protein
MQFLQEAVNTFITPVMRTAYKRNEIAKIKKDMRFQRTDKTMGGKEFGGMCLGIVLPGRWR